MIRKLHNQSCELYDPQAWQQRHQHMARRTPLTAGEEQPVLDTAHHHSPFRLHHTTIMISLAPIKTKAQLCKAAGIRSISVSDVMQNQSVGELASEQAHVVVASALLCAVY